MPSKNRDDEVVDHAECRCPFCSGTGTRMCGELPSLCTQCDGTGTHVTPITRKDMREIKKLSRLGVSIGASVKGDEGSTTRIEVDDIAFKRGP